MNTVKCHTCYDWSAPREDGELVHTTFESETQEGWGFCPKCVRNFQDFGSD